MMSSTSVSAHRIHGEMLRICRLAVAGALLSFGKESEAWQG
jgi:hypothetical protein